MGNKINTLIGSGISIKGIFYQGVVHVEASVEGSLIAHKDKDSKLFINKSSVIKGSVDGLMLLLMEQFMGMFMFIIYYNLAQMLLLKEIFTINLSKWRLGLRLMGD